jgi:hypothetical protein
VSVLSEQPTLKSQVFRHDGTTLGQGRVPTGILAEAAGLEAVPMVTAAVEDTSVPGPLAVTVLLGFSAGLELEMPLPVAGIVMVSVTGQTVVETGIVTMVVVTDLAGQLVTVGAQLVMVETTVVKMVEVLR